MRDLNVVEQSYYSTKSDLVLVLSRIMKNRDILQ